MATHTANDTNRAVAHRSPSPSTGDEPQISERPTEQLKDGEPQRKFPQEILDLIWNEALAPWLKKRVIVVNYIAPAYVDGIYPPYAPSQMPFKCENPLDLEAGELIRNIRLVDRRARNTISHFLRKDDRDMFPKSRDLSRRDLHESFREQYADFGHDVFWLSRGFLDRRFSLVRAGEFGARGPCVFPPQPSHMMLSLRHMLAIMQMVFIGDTPCLTHRRSVRPTHYIPDELHNFLCVVQVRPGTERLRALTVLIPQSLKEWNGEVDYEVLEHRPYGKSVEEKESVLKLAWNPSNQSQLGEVLSYWRNLVFLAENRSVDLPALQFARHRS